jgi:hypothetical protein
VHLGFVSRRRLKADHCLHSGWWGDGPARQRGAGLLELFLQ